MIFVKSMLHLKELGGLVANVNEDVRCHIDSWKGEREEIPFTSCAKSAER